MNDYAWWFRLSGTCAAAALTALAGSRVAPATWGALAYLLLASVVVEAIAAGSMLFAGWRPKLPTKPPAPVGFASNTKRRFTSEQLRAVAPEAAQDE